MNERLTTRDLAEYLANQTDIDRKRAEEFIDALSSYITQGIERNKFVKILGLGTFKIVLVRERESVHIQTGERFVIPAHHKLSFVPDKDFKEQINRPFAFFEPVETMESDALAAKPQKVTFKKENEETVDHEEISLQDEFVDATVRPDGDNRYATEELYETSVDLDMEDSFEYEDFPEITDSFATEINDEALPEQDYDFSEIEEQSEIIEELEPASFIDQTEYEETEQASAYTAYTAYTDAEKKEEQLPDVELKSKAVPLWLWFLLLPLLFVVGVGSGTFAFLQYNSDRTLKVKQPANVSEMASVTVERSPLPIGLIQAPDGEHPDNANEVGLFGDAIPDGNANENSAAEENKNDESQPASATPEKKTEKKVIDWLAPSPENPRSEPKRADKPNKEIEEKNKALANNIRNAQTPSANAAKTTAGKDKGASPSTTNASLSTTNASPSTTNGAKTLPARIRMSAGSSLTQIAMEYYGDKIFWVYIYEHNKSRIKNFDNIPVGTELQLPSPKTYGIDAKSNSSVQKARQKQSQLMKWDNWDDYK
ncbi:MAG: HU family DNA-binding protein [Tannerella sp.]|nr:HU family DNA-binding protein [Tannerella sp.]